MYNFAIPARPKAYIDHIVRVGVTVTADNRGLRGKSADIILASGGDFSPGSPVEKYNPASGYLRQVLAWIGVADVSIILAGRALAGAYGESAVERLAARWRPQSSESFRLLPWRRPSAGAVGCIMHGDG
jgi:FMN-dependent NADH-azoreductase